MADTSRGGPSGGQLPMVPLKKSAFWIAIVIVVLIIMIDYAARLTYRRVTGRSPSRSAEKVETIGIRMQKGTLIIDSTHWTGVIVAGDERVDVKLLTRDLFWDVMLDSDTNRMFHLYPVNWKIPGRTNDHLEIDLKYGNGFNKMEWRISPEHHRNVQGEIAYIIHPKSDGPAF